ncbi:MAG: 2Fe-2S iron-sulfur cluster binding domain-containing protein, partial [Rhodospirillaceae bacterium]|nr:2Fe-2S iron-sulfur cluster binding domain-containing protein [Rhodospirillaceae bacterium]
MVLQFTLNGEMREVSGVSPTMTVLDYLRENASLTGTKEGCAEGDCGACTIVLAETVDGKPDYKAVNACLLMVPQLDGKHVFTVEGLSASDDLLDPVQDAMVKTDGTQCGFCTPGIIMSLFALRQSEAEVTDG